MGLKEVRLRWMRLYYTSYVILQINFREITYLLYYLTSLIKQFSLILTSNSFKEA